MKYIILTLFLASCSASHKYAIGDCLSHPNYVDKYIIQIETQNENDSEYPYTAKVYDFVDKVMHSHQYVNKDHLLANTKVTCPTNLNEISKSWKKE